MSPKVLGLLPFLSGGTKTAITFGKGSKLAVWASRLKGLLGKGLWGGTAGSVLFAGNQIKRVADALQQDGKKKKKPSQEGAVRFLQGSGADPSSAVIDADVTGRETIGGDLAGFTQVPDLDLGSPTGSGIDSIIQEINKINRNIMAIRDAMFASAMIESGYRRAIEEDLQQDIADRDKQRSQGRSADRRDNLTKKKSWGLLDKPKAVAKDIGGAGLNALALETAALFLDDTRDDVPEYENQGWDWFNVIPDNMFRINRPEGSPLNFFGADQSREGYENQGWDVWDWLPDDWFNFKKNDDQSKSSDGSTLNLSTNSKQLSSISNIFSSKNNIANFNVGADFSKSFNSSLINNSEFIKTLQKGNIGITPKGDEFEFYDLRTASNSFSSNGKSSITGGNIIPDGEPGRGITYESFVKSGNSKGWWIN